LHHVAILVKAFKDGTALNPLYNALLQDAMENPKLRNAFMKAIGMDNMKLHGFCFTVCFMSMSDVDLCVGPNPWLPTFPKQLSLPSMSYPRC
jgi:hypothetical protein